MNRQMMKHLAGHMDESHEICPKAWKGTPNISGDYDLDQTILHRKNPNMRALLEMHLTRRPYHPRTAYNGYHGYHGDD